MQHCYKMNGISNFFSDKYVDLINNLINEYFDKFENAKDENERITLLYPHLRCINITPGIYGKCLESAQKEKFNGNAYFGKYDSSNALKCYSSGILQCPQDTPESRKLLSVLVANRSACLYDLKNYERALNDINYVTLLSIYPEHLKFKLYYREAKCHAELKNNPHLATASYKLACDYLDLSTLDKSVIQTKKREIQKELKIINCEKKFEDKSKCATFKSNPKFPAASNAVTFDYDPKLGRFARAAANINAGEIIIKEHPHCAVLLPQFLLTHCQYCAKATIAPLPCDKCANVGFCSLKCKSSSVPYHQFECGLQPTIAESGASINCFMGLRMITQKSLKYFQTIIKGIENLDDVHVYQNYSCVYKLCRNEQLRKTKDSFHCTMIAVYLLRVLKASTYFDYVTKDDVLTNTEIFICKLLMHNLQLLQFNAHEISEVHKAPPQPSDPQDVPNFKSVSVGGGIYPTLAFFNHSCDPSIVRYHIGTEVVVKSVKPIKKGEIIYENYGPIYTTTIRSERKSYLLSNYWFECTCQACEEDWPLFKDMELNVIKIPCKNSKCNSYFYLNENIENPTILCSSCNCTTNLFPHLKALAELESSLPEAENFFKGNCFDKAIELYTRAMEIYSKNTVPPFPDWVQVQQRLRTCFVNCGNRCAEYDETTFFQ
ncbi:hypothetical protein FQA39_LY04498 [Lamprigera yunnana]|nr:hypothetical protein FQA39_LY04498 [Lamprigera yunnana]